MRGQSACVVRSYLAGRSPFGLYDMAGNVYEWTVSGYSSDYREPRDNAARVYRGGGWGNGIPTYVRGADRNRYTPTRRDDAVGFRCAR